MRFSLETLREVWNDDNADCIEIGPDRGSLGLVELRSKNREGKIIERMSFPPEMAKLVAQAILSCVSDFELKEKSKKAGQES